MQPHSDGSIVCVCVCEQYSLINETERRAGLTGRDEGGSQRQPGDEDTRQTTVQPQRETQDHPDRRLSTIFPSWSRGAGPGRCLCSTVRLVARGSVCYVYLSVYLSVCVRERDRALRSVSQLLCILSLKSFFLCVLVLIPCPRLRHSKKGEKEKTTGKLQIPNSVKSDELPRSQHHTNLCCRLSLRYLLAKMSIQKKKLAEKERASRW